MAMVAVQFKTNYDRYNSGEIAGFEAEEAGRLVASAIAVPYPPKREAGDGEGSQAQAAPESADETTAPEVAAVPLERFGKRGRK